MSLPKLKTQSLVNSVFNSVSSKYDVMNDVMSFGIHRLWKKTFVEKAIQPQKGMSILECAAGSGDISFRILDQWRKMGATDCQLMITDINASMLETARTRLANTAILDNLPGIKTSFDILNAQEIPESLNESFDCYVCAFGMRNMPNLDVALRSAHRVLKKGGTFHCLEFSKVQNPLFRAFYDIYSTQVIPPTGHLITGSWESYEYLVDSIRLFPEQAVLAHMLEKAGFFGVKYFNMTNGIVCVHSAVKM
ncbi:2-methoxy-6-polyprenyl-14-benzoquinol methylase mitochondrial precursor [Perkinsela sp. CCAP 1560/4]|nr:2-methoxy-6-polyprenyl-14-benzoquinol methylase mitochondrial precursor [Perkinsela sp. CCAP 1560/4]|eukprot:KNH07334.1 2-methoxy-6-polyprenyl-14-benzoquinol methylase mitochondrial precursor [Perkinsela sp. CCAP 1560/4]